ncbi:MAG: transketolase [Alphaproteobacteria bacterium]|nr:transketolase [Alphaproteobacteria bacterium]
MTLSSSATSQENFDSIIPASNYELANAIRILAADAVEKAQSGHPGMPMGIADVATVLFSKFIKFYPSDPLWPNRDRFILSAGHGSMLLYSLLFLTGYKDMTLEELKKFRQLGSLTPGHPEYGHTPGIETTTGPLGQGLGNAVGMAIAEQSFAAQFGNDLVNHFTYVIVGDGCLMEGISQEVISLAGHLKLNKLIVLFDDNHISIDGPTSLATSENHIKRFEACGWDTWQIDGHNHNAIASALEQAQKSHKPSFIACRTIIGYGAPNKAGTSATHGAPLGKDEVAGVRTSLQWSHEPFIIPDHILKSWRNIGNKNKADYDIWQKTFDQHPQKQEFKRRLSGQLPLKLNTTFEELKKYHSENPKAIATRVSSQKVLETIQPVIPELFGGSADLTGSNNTKIDAMSVFSSTNSSGSYIYYGVREHGMAAIMNGLALHKSHIPYGGSFLVFTDYCRPSIRLAALMHLRVIYVMTHDSIGLGEDGPTHQPIEHLASLRAIPNLLVLRPADTVETIECWDIALHSYNQPSILVLSRQSLPSLRQKYTDKNLSSQGGYIISEAIGPRKTSIIATGSELHIALEAQKKLHDQNIGTAVISLPCWELFSQQALEYQKHVLGQDQKNHICIAIEAASSFGWEKFVKNHDYIISIDRFGASGPAPDLYQYFNITSEKIVNKITSLIS